MAKNPQDSPLRVVIATVALGMGADLRYVSQVIHAGPPKNSILVEVDEIVKCSVKQFCTSIAPTLGVQTFQRKLRSIAGMTHFVGECF